jgi:hypothetical protein
MKRKCFSLSKSAMKGFFLVVAACAVLAATSSVAWANLVLIHGTPAASFTDITAQGFGNAPRMLTLQTNTVETGNVTPVDVVHGDAVPGANKSTTPTLSVLGWSSGAEVGIGFNSNQTGQSGITLQSLTLTIFNNTTAVGSFSLAAPVQFSAADLALQQGNGSAVFNFGLTAAEQIQFNTILAMAGSAGFFAGLSSQLGCPAGAPPDCQPSNDGADSFLGFRQSIAVPEPTTIVFLGFGLVAFGWFYNRKVRA